MREFYVEASPDNPDIPALEAMRNENMWVLENREGEANTRVVGRLLGFGSSQRADHTHGRGGGEPSRRRCPACRWFEIRILRVSEQSQATPGPYLVHTLGPSTVPGERTFVRSEFAVTAYEVIELCTVRQGERGEPYMPAAAARALSQAAGVDDAIQDAYVNRAVA